VLSLCKVVLQESLEMLKVQKYVVDGHYSHHFDWRSEKREIDRLSSFMVYLEANYKGGGTEFPKLLSAAKCSED
jgi:prolyl 4-hydroxylase